ncbi:DinB family protein [Salipaludibacillus aurantiacus]|uniref:Uncharacterized damage-inducible protein DinB (Forms a four-helix bundle) n=1 Tax=Salipaludibacillus aurantiacus TaxID=1601833 RepID=A0A1H9Q8G6_9BACI|nr:DinB family protein [Salipaludibacillus aurantiacus]SER56734.1 Uncharacterized damage-inducible protein DinB (forms a four-helix bundle) [Salipaludibacillus aurantiacus]
MSKSASLKNYFLSHRKVTNELIDKIEPQHFDYKPAPTSMSAKELVIHMLTTFHMFAASAAKQAPEPIHQTSEEDDLRKLADKYTDEAVKLIESLSDDSMNNMIDLTDIIGSTLPAEKVLEIAVVHEIHHKGNLFVYVREMGHTDLPLFIKT